MGFPSLRPRRDAAACRADPSGGLLDRAALRESPPPNSSRSGSVEIAKSASASDAVARGFPSGSTPRRSLQLAYAVADSNVAKSLRDDFVVDALTRWFYEVVRSRDATRSDVAMWVWLVTNPRTRGERDTRATALLHIVPGPVSIRIARLHPRAPSGVNKAPISTFSCPVSRTGSVDDQDLALATCIVVGLP